MDTPNGLNAIKDLFSFPFRDPQWKTKFLMGSGLALVSSFVPLLPLLPLLGYCARITRQAVASQVAQPISQPTIDETAPNVALPVTAPALPEWDGWDDLFIDGLRQIGVLLVINLPLALILGVGFGAYFGLLFTSIAGQVANQGREVAFSLLTFAAVGVLFLTMGLTFLLAPITFLFLPTTSAHVAMTRRFGALFEVNRWFRVLRSNISGYFVLLFFLAGLYMVLMLVFQMVNLTFFCCFLLLPVISSVAVFYTTLLFYHISGLAYAGGSAS